MGDMPGTVSSGRGTVEAKGEIGCGRAICGVAGLAEDGGFWPTVDSRVIGRVTGAGGAAVLGG